MQHTQRAALIVCTALASAWGCTDPAPPAVQVTVDPDSVAPETPSITGRVLDAETRLPIAGAQVDTTPPTEARSTDAQGRYILTQGVAPSQDYTLRARADGYVEGRGEVSVGEGKTLHGELALTPERVALEALTMEPEALRFAADQQRISARIRASPDLSAPQPWRVELPASVDWLTITPKDGTLDPGDARALDLTLDRARALEALAARDPAARSAQTTLTLIAGERRLTRDVVAVLGAEAQLALIGVTPALDPLPERLVIDDLDALEFDVRATRGASTVPIRDARVVVTLGAPDAPSLTREAQTGPDGTARVRLELSHDAQQPPTLPLTVMLPGYPNATRTLTLVREACPVELRLELQDQANHAPLLYVSDPDASSRLRAVVTAAPCQRLGDGVDMTLVTNARVTSPSPTARLTPEGGTFTFELVPDDANTDAITATLQFDPRGRAVTTRDKLTLERLDTSDAVVLESSPVFAAPGALSVTATVQTTAGEPVTGLRREDVELCLGAQAPCVAPDPPDGALAEPVYRFTVNLDAPIPPALLAARVRFATPPSPDAPRYVALDSPRCVATYPDPLPLLAATTDGAQASVFASVVGPGLGDIVSAKIKLYAVDDRGERALLRDAFVYRDCAAPDRDCMELVDDDSRINHDLFDLEVGTYIVELYGQYTPEACQGAPIELPLGEPVAFTIAEDAIPGEALGPKRLRLLVGEEATVSWRVVDGTRQPLPADAWRLGAPIDLDITPQQDQPGAYTFNASREGAWRVPLIVGDDVLTEIEVSAGDPVLVTSETANHDGTVYVRGCAVWEHSITHPEDTPVDLQIHWASDRAPDTMRPVTRGFNPPSRLRGVPVNGDRHRFAWDSVRDAGLAHTTGQLHVTAQDQGIVVSDTPPTDIVIQNGVLLRTVEFAPNRQNTNAEGVVWHAGSFGYLDGGGLAVAYTSGGDLSANVARFPGLTSNGTFGFLDFDPADSFVTQIAPTLDTPPRYDALLTAQLGASGDATGPELVVVWEDRTLTGAVGVITLLEGADGAGSAQVTEHPTSGLGFDEPNRALRRVVALNDPNGPEGYARLALLNEAQVRIASGPLDALGTVPLGGSVGDLAFAELVAGRFNDDPWDDLAVFYTDPADSSALFLKSYSSDGGAFVFGTLTPTGILSPSDVRAVVVDWDRDGRDDVVAAVVAGGESGIWLWRNVTPATLAQPRFAQGRPLTTLGFPVSALLIDDLDADRRWDAVVLHQGRMRVVSALGSEDAVSLDDTEPTRLCSPDDADCAEALDGAWHVNQVLLRDLDGSGRPELVVLADQGLATFEAAPPPSRCAAAWSAPETVPPVSDPIAHHLVQLSGADDALDLISLHATDTGASWTRFERGERAAWERDPRDQAAQLSEVVASAVFRGRSPHNVSHVIEVDDLQFALQSPDEPLFVDALPEACGGSLRQLHPADLDGDGLETVVLACSTGTWRLNLSPDGVESPTWTALVADPSASTARVAVAPLEGTGDARADLILMSGARLDVFYNAPGGRWVPAQGNPQLEADLNAIRDMHIGVLDVSPQALPTIFLLEDAPNAPAKLRTLHAQTGTTRWRSAPVAALENDAASSARTPHALTLFHHPEVAAPIVAVVFQREVPGAPGQREFTLDLWAFRGDDQIPPWSAEPLPWATPWRTFQSRADVETFEQVDVIAADLDRDTVADLVMLTPTPTLIRLARDATRPSPPYMRLPNDDDGDTCPDAVWLARDEDGALRPRVDIRRQGSPLRFEHVDFGNAPEAPMACEETVADLEEADPTHAVVDAHSTLPGGVVRWGGAQLRAMTRDNDAAFCAEDVDGWVQLSTTLTLDNAYDLRALRASAPGKTLPVVVHASNEGRLVVTLLEVINGGLGLMEGINSAFAGDVDLESYVGLTAVDLDGDGGEDALVFQARDGAYTARAAVFGREEPVPALVWDNGDADEAEATAAWVGDLDGDGALDAAVFEWVSEGETSHAALRVASDVNPARWPDARTFGEATYTRVIQLGDAPIHRVEGFRLPGTGETVLIATPSAARQDAPAWSLVFGRDGALIQAQALMLGDAVSSLAWDDEAPALYSVQRVPGGQCAVRRLDSPP